MESGTFSLESCFIDLGWMEIVKLTTRRDDEHEHVPKGGTTCKTARKGRRELERTPGLRIWDILRTERRGLIWEKTPWTRLTWRLR